ncbi:unnamed protein product, partial [Rotaria sp. Silwood2]
MLTSPIPVDLKNLQSVINARRFYETCINETVIESESINVILSIVNDLGGWPILQGSSWNETSFNITNLLIRLREYGYNMIFGFGTSNDDKNSSTNFIRFYQSDIALAQRSNYLNETKVTRSYRQFIQDVGLALAAGRISLEMINNIRNSFLGMLKNSSWMDEISKNKSIEKALVIDEKIGYPDFLGSNNTTQLEKMYQEYVFNESYISNVLKLLKIKANENLRMLRELVDRKAWGTSPPTIVNAFYSPPRNQIIFPAGILQMPFFNKDAPKYLNYGAIGMVIGHEITHGFDDSGRQYDKDGNRISWWTDDTIKKFNERKQCIIDQYSNYVVTQINRTLNGFQTQGENIADNGGIKESFYAYQNWIRTHPNEDKKLPGLSEYSAEQMFFINYGQIWCSKMTNANALNRILTGVHSPEEF